ncbi:hypothetical protein QQF64_009876, partial [Cirrhinus molitorella]
LSGLMPETVQVQDTRLAVQKVDDVINTTFICEVKNSLGYGKDQVTIFVREPIQGPATGAIIAGILCVIILLALIATAIVIVRKRQRKNIDRPPTHKPPPPMKTYSYSERPSISKPVNDPQFMDYETEKAEPMTNLSAYHDDKDHHEPSRCSWEDKQTSYQDEDEGRMMGDEDDYYVTSSASRGSSFMSPAVVV